MRKLIAAIVGFLSVTLIASPAHAARPLVTEDVRFDGTPEVDPFLSQQCGFPVSVSQTGHFRGTIFYDKDGNARLETGHPSIKTTFTSPYGSVETADRGLDKYLLNPDGTLLVFGTGIHLRVKGQVYAIGLWRLTVNLETDELVAQEYHGNFDVQAPQIAETLCHLLGPGSA